MIVANDNARNGQHEAARDGLARWMPRALAVAVATALSSFVFVQLHLDPDQVGYGLIYLVFGVVCALAYELTGSLAAPILVHTLNNGWAFFVLSLAIGRLLGDRSAASAS